MELPHAFLEWMIAVTEHWHGYVSGTILAFVLELIKRFRDWEPSKRVFAGIVAAGLVCSMFSTWHEEYKKTHPGFNLQIEGLAVGPSPYINGEAEVFLWASLINRSNPSIADYWKLTVIHGKDAPVYGKPRQLDPKEPLNMYSNGKAVVTIDPGDALYAKTMKEPIATGMKEVGVLWFDVPLSFADADATGTIYILECQDASGNKTNQKYVKGSGKKAEYGYLPGMKQ
jgi:hypothetical protein